MNNFSSKEHVEFFGVKFDLVTMEEALERIARIIEQHNLTQYVGVNVAILVMAQRDKELRNILNSCKFITADGLGILWGAKLLGIHIPERVPAVDLMLNLMPIAEKKGYRMFFLGASGKVIKKAVEKCKSQYPDLQIAGYHSGYFKKEEEEKIVEEIINSKADILCVGMPSPEKELFIRKNLQRMNIPFAMGVGGTFDVIAEKVKRAPIWMQKMGMEWIYRLLQEPRKMWKRYLVTNSKYAWMLIKTKLYIKG